MKLNLILIFCAFVSIMALLAWWTNRERQAAINEEIIKQQNQQIEVQHEIIEVKKQVQQRKAIARAISTNDNLEWLRKARCKDCAV